MRRHGRIVEWHGERGFGFVCGDDDGERAFAHVIDFTERGGMPAVGDRVSYEPAEDEPGRPRATNIRYALPASTGDAARRGASVQGRHVSGLALLLCLVVLGAGILHHQRLSDGISRAAVPARVAAVADVREPVHSGAVTGGEACASPRGCGDAPACGPPQQPARDCRAAGRGGHPAEADGRKVARSPLR